jgi:hypothetical protein
MRLVLLIVVLLLAAGALAAPGASASALPVIGGAEEAVLLPWGLRIRSRVDTGAAISSVDARSIRVHTVNHKRMVQFVLTGDQGQQITMDLPLPGYRRVATTDGGAQRRPVVEMDLCLAGQRLRAELSLNDRSHMEYHMLIGRNVLAGRFLVDVATQNLGTPVCPAAP